MSSFQVLLFHFLFLFLEIIQTLVLFSTFALLVDLLKQLHSELLYAFLAPHRTPVFLRIIFLLFNIVICRKLGLFTSISDTWSHLGSILPECLSTSCSARFNLAYLFIFIIRFFIRRIFIFIV